MIAWLPLRDIPTTLISVSFTTRGGIPNPYPSARRAKAAASTLVWRGREPAEVDAVAQPPGEVDAAGMRQVRRHHDRVAGVGLDRRRPLRRLHQQAAVVPAPGAERHPDDSQVGPAFGPGGLLVEVEGDLRLRPLVRELQQDLRLADPPGPPLLRQRLGQREDLLAVPQVGEPVRPPEPIAQLLGRGAPLQQIEVKQPQRVVDLLLRDDAMRDLKSALYRGGWHACILCRRPAEADPDAL